MRTFFFACVPGVRIALEVNYTGAVSICISLCSEPRLDYETQETGELRVRRFGAWEKKENMIETPLQGPAHKVFYSLEYHVSILDGDDDAIRHDTHGVVHSTLGIVIM